MKQFPKYSYQEEQEIRKLYQYLNENFDSSKTRSHFIDEATAYGITEISFLRQLNTLSREEVNRAEERGRAEAQQNLIREGVQQRTNQQGQQQHYNSNGLDDEAAERRAAEKRLDEKYGVGWQTKEKECCSCQIF